MSDLFQRLKHMVVEDEPAASKPATTHFVAPPPVSAPATATVPDPAIRAILDKEVRAAAAPALLALEDTCASLATIIPDERLRVRAALAAIAAQGHTVAAIQKDVDECFATLDAKARENAAAAEAAAKDKVGSREEKIGELVREISAKTKEMTDLRAAIEKLDASKLELQNEIERERAAIADVHARFMATVSAERAEVSAWKAKLEEASKA